MPQKADKKGHGIIITGHGVSIDWYGGASTHTNINPMNMFPGQKKLSEANLIKIIDLVIASGFEGKKYSNEEMQDFYEEWKKLGEP